MPLIEQGRTRTFEDKVRNFSHDAYPLRESDHLTKLLRTLLEDPGVGSLQKAQAAAHLSETLYTTLFTDLDVFFGLVLGFPRKPSEFYIHGESPFTGQLTVDEWSETYSKDSLYRERIYRFMLAMSKGSTPLGLQLAAESIVDFPCNIRESWQYNSDLGGNVYPGRLTDLNDREVAVQVGGSYTDLEERAWHSRLLYSVLNRLKPPSVLLTVYYNLIPSRIDIGSSFRGATATSTFFGLRKLISAGKVTSDSLSLSSDQEDYYWADLQTEVEAPTPAFINRSHFEIDINSAVQRIVVPHDAVMFIQSAQQFTNWIQFDKANSPDNYPNGIREDGIHEWVSQQEYEEYQTQQVVGQGGEVSGSSYRLPLSSTELTNEERSQILALPAVEIEGGWFG